MRAGGQAPAYAALETEFDDGVRRQTHGRDRARRRPTRRRRGRRIEPGRQPCDAASPASTRSAAAQPTLVRETTGDRTFSDVNYIIPTFILTQLPIGLIGLLIVAIIMAATDTIAGELNSLSTATVIDFYKRWFRPDGDRRSLPDGVEGITGVWGLFACAVAVWAAELGSLIEVVNRFGSFFYGSILGVFILAVAVPRATGTGAFVGLIAGMASVALVASFTKIAFLWHNVVGAVVVVVVGVVFSAVMPSGRAQRTP